MMQTPSEVAAMLKLEQWGWSISRIAAAFAVDRKTVRRYVRAGCWMGYKPRERSSGALACRGVNEQRNRPRLGHNGKHSPLQRQADPIRRGGRPNPAGAEGSLSCRRDRPLAQHAS